MPPWPSEGAALLRSDASAAAPMITTQDRRSIDPALEGWTEESLAIEIGPPILSGDVHRTFLISGPTVLESAAEISTASCGVGGGHELAIRFAEIAMSNSRARRRNQAGLSGTESAMGLSRRSGGDQLGRRYRHLRCQRRPARVHNSAES